MFEPILDRPKQAIHHLLELFILHICRLDDTWDQEWLSSVVQYLAAISQHLIPAIQPSKSVQWKAAVFDKRGKIVGHIPQSEESYPKNQTISSKPILDIISSYASAFTEDDITKEELSCLTGLMDEPAKTAIMVYAWYLNSFGVKNGWLRQYFYATLGRRERPRDAPPDSLKEDVIAGGRLGRSEEELHTLFAPPFLDQRGHLIWYTVRQATRGEIIGRPATSYARGNNVRIQSTRDISRSIQIHHSHVCNASVLDIRLWDSWTHQARGVGPFRSLSNSALSAKTVRFDKPVLIEHALAVGFRVVGGCLISPAGRLLLVTKGENALYKARFHLLRNAEQETLTWHTGMQFA